MINLIKENQTPKNKKIDNNILSKIMNDNHNMNEVHSMREVMNDTHKWEPHQ